MVITMPRDGSGGYSLTSNAFSTAVTGGTLVAGDANTVWADLVAATAASLCTDGQSTMSGNLKMGGQKITGQAVGTANTDGLTLGQAQNGAFDWGGVAAGADTITFALSPVITAYVDGQTFFFVASASPNTGAATLNINSVGAKAIQKAGAALVAGDIAASKVYAVTYYNNIFHLWSPVDLSSVALLAASNTFTAAQLVTLTAAGTALTLTSTDAGAASGPDLVFRRASASPAASDITGSFTFVGKDSGGNDTIYVKFNSFIADPTNGSEDGGFILTTLAAGADANWIFQSGEMYYSSLLSAKNIAGAINATQVYVGGHGTVAQRVNDIESTLTTSATTIPFDDTIPQNTEGVEVLSVAITPINASSVLYIDVSVQVGLSTTNTVTAALFVDATASAIDAMGESVDASTIRTIKFTHVVSAGSTSARTYKVNVGGASGTVSLNGIAGTTRRYGGVTQSTLVVTEVLPQ